MNVARFASAAVLGLLVASSARAQVVARPAPINPAPRMAYPAAYSYPVAAYPAYRLAPRVVYSRPVVMPHVAHYRDWTTGRENLPLAKPWLHSSR